MTLHLPAAVTLGTVRLKVHTLKHLQDGEASLAFVLDISATDLAGQVVTHFTAPLTLTLRLADLLGSLDHAYVAYFNPQTHVWEGLPLTARDARAGTVSFRTDHFSTYGGGIITSVNQFTSPAAWTLKFNDASVSTFDDGLSWAYDLNLPTRPGALKRVTDLNRAATAYAYDPLGRLMGVVRLGDSFTAPTTVYTYYDTGTGVFTLTAPLKIETARRTVSVCLTCALDTLAFYDGLGQLVQSRSPAADPGQQVVADTLYDPLGLVAAPDANAVRRAGPRGAGGQPRRQRGADGLPGGDHYRHRRQWPSQG